MTNDLNDHLEEGMMNIFHRKLSGKEKNSKSKIILNISAHAT